MQYPSMLLVEKSRNNVFIYPSISTVNYVSDGDLNISIYPAMENI